MKEWLARFALVLAPLALGELGARALLPEPPRAEGGDWHFEFDARRNYRWKAEHEGVFGTQPFRTNADHLVGPPVPRPRRAGRSRLAVLGDSVSFGFNVPYEQGFVPRLSEKLGAEVLNFGVPGYSTFQEFADLEDSLAWCPDLVLLQFSFNDLAEPFLYLRRLGGLGIDYHRVPDVSGLHFLLRQYSRLYAALADRLTTTAVSTYGKEEMRAMLERTRLLGERAMLEKPESDAARAAFGELAYWLHRMGERCRAEAVPCVFLPGPASFRWFYASPELEAGIARLLAVAGREGLEVLEPWPELRAKLERGRGGTPVVRWNELFLDQIHPTAAGHAWLADFLAPRLRAILSRSPARACGGH